MDSKEFTQNVLKQSIKNGTIFDVIHEEDKIGQVGVIRDNIVYLEFKDETIPVDLLTGEYKFIEVEEV